MNEQIAKLANQSGFDVDSTGKFGNYSEIHRLEKFAELIIRECANIVNSLEQYEGQGDCSTAEYIKEHFGVE